MAHVIIDAINLHVVGTDGQTAPAIGLVQSVKGVCLVIRDFYDHVPSHGLSDNDKMILVHAPQSHSSSTGFNSNPLQLIYLPPSSCCGTHQDNGKNENVGNHSIPFTPARVTVASSQAFSVCFYRRNRRKSVRGFFQVRADRFDPGSQKGVPGFSPGKNTMKFRVISSNTSRIV
jgi:hypothetical protein